MPETLVDHALGLLAQNAYLTLGTVDPEGRPWISPVYFAADGLRDFYWTSSLDARHSRNLAAHPGVSLVVFDSTVAPYHGRAVYAAGVACELAGEELRRGLGVYPGRAERGIRRLTISDVSRPSPWRLYRVRASEVWVLCPREPQQPCTRHGRSDDHRERIVP